MANIYLQLGVSTVDLDDIEETLGPESMNMLRGVFIKWEAKPRSNKPFTWQTMLDALRSEEIKEYRLADEIAENFSMASADSKAESDTQPEFQGLFQNVIQICHHTCESHK